jgi:hypothetical protein
MCEGGKRVLPRLRARVRLHQQRPQKKLLTKPSPFVADPGGVDHSPLTMDDTLQGLALIEKDNNDDVLVTWCVLCHRFDWQTL